jgi:hypothetical protein
MRGDFSRLRFDRTKHYTSVLEQQGRLALDADRNEQCVIDEYIRAIETIDVIGPFGGPKDNAGFAITIAGNTIEIGAGRYYVDGILCENEGQLGYGEQPFLIHPASADSELLTELSSGTIDSIRLFFEVWHRIVTALDDACLREPALGQTDTTARVQTVWRVVAERTLVRKPIPIPMPTRIPLNPVLLDRAATLSIIAKPLASATLATAATPTGTVAPGAASDASARAAASLSCCEQMYVPLTQPAAGKLSAQTTGGAADCSCQPTPAAGYRGLENQLYRVEIHRSGSESTATFKWSRENGSVVAGVISISGADVVVDSIGPDANLGFQPGQWVELSDDSYLFGPVPNQPGELFQIKSVSPEHRTITMTGSVSQIDPSRNARLRRWEQFGISATVNGVALSTGLWLDLENGVQVRFAAGNFESGDYWLIPARTATGQIEWPPCGSDGAAFQPPIRTHVHRAPLACIHWDAKAQKTIIEDCRRFFPPLTEVSANAVSTAIHVTKINWANDDVMTFDELIQNGLLVSIDQTVTGQLGPKFARHRECFLLLECTSASRVGVGRLTRRHFLTRGELRHCGWVPRRFSPSLRPVCGGPSPASAVCRGMGKIAFQIQHGPGTILPFRVRGLSSSSSRITVSRCASEISFPLFGGRGQSELRDARRIHSLTRRFEIEPRSRPETGGQSQERRSRILPALRKDRTEAAVLKGIRCRHENHWQNRFDRLHR